MTEFSDPRYRDLDRWDSLTALRAIWESQMAAIASIGPALPALAALVEAALPRLRAGGGWFMRVRARRSALPCRMAPNLAPPSTGPKRAHNI